MSIPSTTWWLSRNIPPRSSKIPGTGCPGIIRPAYPSTIPDDPAPPNILNQRCAACCAKTGRHGERLPPSLTPGKFFLATQAYRKHTKARALFQQAFNIELPLKPYLFHNDL